MKGLSFFKAFLLTRSSENLPIPSAFDGELPKQALLRNHRGNVCRVRITNTGSKFYFSNGWANFVEKNNIQDGDFLVFDYDGSLTFDVKIYGNTTCEKTVPKYEESEEIEIKESSDESDESYAESKEYEDETEEEEFELGNMRKGKEKMAKSAKGPQIMKQKGKGVQTKKDQGLQMAVVRSPGADYKGKCAAETEEESSDEDEDEVFKYGIIARPFTPYFVTRLKKKKPNKLYIPLDVIRDHNLEIPTKMIILDDRNKEWKSDVKVWGDGRTWLTNGWKAFKRWNVLTYQDRCLCEFIKESAPKGLFLKIHILREGSWLPKADNLKGA